VCDQETQAAAGARDERDRTPTVRVPARVGAVAVAGGQRGLSHVLRMPGRHRIHAGKSSIVSRRMNKITSILRP
jgi:hypothetical protein